MWLLSLILLGLIIYFIWYSQRGYFGRGRGEKEREDPLDILKIRYAKGEITKEQFEDMKKDLEAERGH